MACKIGSTNGGCTRQSVSSACSAFDLRLLRMHVRKIQSRPVKSAPTVEASSDVAAARLRAVSAAGGAPSTHASTSSSSGCMLVSMDRRFSASAASKGTSSPASRNMRPSARARGTAALSPPRAPAAGLASESGRPGNLATSAAIYAFSSDSPAPPGSARSLSRTDTPLSPLFFLSHSLSVRRGVPPPGTCIIKPGSVGGW
jgi:hypothetical protein